MVSKNISYNKLMQNLEVNYYPENTDNPPDSQVIAKAHPSGVQTTLLIGPTLTPG